MAYILPEDFGTSEDFEPLIEAMAADLATLGDLRPETLQQLSDAANRHIGRPGLARLLLLEATARAGGR